MFTGIFPGSEVIAEDAIYNCLTCDQHDSTFKHNRRHKDKRTNTHPEFWGNDRCHRHRSHHHSRHSPHHPEDVQQADTCSQSPGSQRRLQTSAEDVPIHGPEQHAAEHHGSQLRVGQHLQFKPGLGERLPAAQSRAHQLGGKPHRAVQHHQRLHSHHHTLCSISRKHIATRLWCSLTTTGTD